MQFLRLKEVINLLSSEVFETANAEKIPLNRCIDDLRPATDNSPPANGGNSLGANSHFDTISREVNCKINKKCGTGVSTSSKESAKKRVITYILVPLTYK